MAEGVSGSCATRPGPTLPYRRAGPLPGPALTTATAPDHRGRRSGLHLPAVLGPGDRVLLVDDWAERGSQAEAAAGLVRRSGAALVGVSPVVDELPDDVRVRLGPVTALVTRAELGDPAGRARGEVSGWCAGWPGATRR
ncbi:adenine phosphoribosyltransferase [Geodermatophilus bullaregiensis]|uniref:phosphoribosyltransferase n=1 Tax=Geodermatophilus bullaregiensis TaxID=1564160 RepID=UPI00195620A6|nr:phosphoribosyltransferase [Geodermatophilus bullaregiensis]MBM7804736.1 adenine phosphoribosyltransferase [Geodermatophilus bullaregiensis]